MASIGRAHSNKPVPGSEEQRDEMTVSRALNEATCNGQKSDLAVSRARKKKLCEMREAREKGTRRHQARTHGRKGEAMSRTLGNGRSAPAFESA